LVPIKVAFEMLEQDYLLVDLLRVGEEIKVLHKVFSTLLGLSVDVVEVETVGI